MVTEFKKREYFLATPKLKANFPDIGYYTYEGMIRRILFFYISINHIRDQYFLDEIRKASVLIGREIEKHGIIRFDKFMKIIDDCHLSKYGLKSEEKHGFISYRHTTLDLKWWQKIWELIRHKRDVLIKWVPEGYKE